MALYKEDNGTLKMIYPTMSVVSFLEATNRKSKDKTKIGVYILNWIGWYNHQSSNPNR